ncbi:Pentatricopeptide repeat [Dillenia turbinata]|uniref:Pentatricopeptide repeat n=1 Tax=Dillenia turbinata TaxID=194707 RepID=A0AAN8Z6Q8_9MAGN
MSNFEIPLSDSNPVHFFRFCVNTLIKAYSNSDVPDQAVVFYSEMVKNGFSPNSFTFVPLFEFSDSYENERYWFTLRPNDTTMVSVIALCVRSARLREGRSVDGFLLKMFLKLSVILQTVVIDMYGKCQRGIASMVSQSEGLSLFAEMVDGIYPNREELHPDEITFIGVLCACARLGQQMDGRNYFKRMIDEFGIKPTFAHHWCMANLFVRHGLIQEALEMIRNLPQNLEDQSPQSQCWAHLLGSSRYEGDVSLGEQIARSLIESEPDNLMCYALPLNVYAAGGQWQEVSMLREMVQERGFERRPGCSLVDLNEIVHKFRLQEKPGMEGLNMLMDKVAQKLCPSPCSSK